MPARERQFSLFTAARSAPLWERLAWPLAGVDEAGRGCLAGPVVAAAVVPPPGADLRALLPDLNDSKQLSASTRAVLEKEIKALASAWSLGLAWPREIEEANILQATRRAMARAVARLRVRPEFLLIDGNQTIESEIPQAAIIDGDALAPPIAAASILAKTFRDRLLEKLDKRYPGYGFAKHKGYGTKEHLAALRELGPCVQHRRTFRGVPGWEKAATAAKAGRTARATSLWLPGI
jgi:ribonuclease HII